MKQILIIFFTVLLAMPLPAAANLLPDSDRDGVPDIDEVSVYHTDSNKFDTDGDGFGDQTELINGYSPHNQEPVKLEENDYDGDGLNDRLELNFKTDLSNIDTDSDGFSDNEEIKAGYSPLLSGPVLLEKRIEINLARQELSYFLSGVRLDTFPVSSGLYNSTPRGHYIITNKHPKAWSATGGLWMPYWQGLNSGRIGIHELPVWPNGYTEGEGKLGTPASHGCVRVGKTDALFLYGWAPIGTGVFIY